jgi:Na+-driven multidrug efflux pump
VDAATTHVKATRRQEATVLTAVINAHHDVIWTMVVSFISVIWVGLLITVTAPRPATAPPER